jgi:hypothetical protein
MKIFMQIGLCTVVRIRVSIGISSVNWLIWLGIDITVVLKYKIQVVNEKSLFSVVLGVTKQLL